MAFVKEKYLAEYFRPKSRQKPQVLSADDLFDRYAIKLPASDAQVAETIKAVRAFWGNQQAGTPLQKYAKLCQGADEQLKKELIDAGPNRGKDIGTAAWWEAKASEQQKAAGLAVGTLADLLRGTHGAFGVITKDKLDASAASFSLSEAQGRDAAKQAGLDVLDTAKLPSLDHNPISAYSSLAEDLSAGGTKTVVELIHSDPAPFRLLQRFESMTNPDLRLDATALADAIKAADKQGGGTTWDARRGALTLLQSADRAGTSVRDIAFFHIAMTARRFASFGAAGVKAELLRLGLEESDAGILAVVLTDRVTDAVHTGPERVETLLGEGRLIEATQAAHSLPESEGQKLVVAKIEAARKRFDALMDQARALLALPDELGAAAKLREAAAISADEAEEAMVLVPLAPPRNFEVGGDGRVIKLHWQPNAGYSDGVHYEVIRSTKGVPTNPTAGTLVWSGVDLSCIDSAPPVAHDVYYSVIAKGGARPASRAVSNQMLILPPVDRVHVGVGPDRLTVTWSAHPDVRKVEVIRKDPGAARNPLPVVNGSVSVSGLTEGETVHLELTAVYESSDGRPMRAATVQTSGTPRAAAKALESLRATAISGHAGGGVVRCRWQPIDRSQILLRHAISAPSWSVGAMVSPEEMFSYGGPLSGPLNMDRGWTTLDVDMSVGIHYIVPFSVGGTGTVVGKSTVVGMAESVHGLSATLFTGFAKLSWIWPVMTGMAEVSWQRDDDAQDAVGLLKVTKAQYDQSGVSVPAHPRARSQ